MWNSGIPLTPFFFRIGTTGGATVFSQTMTNEVLIVACMVIVSTDATAGNRFFVVQFKDALGNITATYQPMGAIGPGVTFANILYMPNVAATNYIAASNIMWVPITPTWLLPGETLESFDSAAVSAGDTYTFRTNYYSYNGNGW